MATASSPRYLTKSRFKLALECPTKLYYTGKPEYHDRSGEDRFLRTLAEGGYQVGELAKLMFPGGVTIEDLDHAVALSRTRELLQSNEVTIYEAAFEAAGAFVRVDILVKRGALIGLYEVKAKSYNPDEDGDFRGRGGKLTSEFLPYLQDIAFQRFVVGAAMPGFSIDSHLVLADKSVVASVDGLNQRFRVNRMGRRIRVEVIDASPENIGSPILRTVDVNDQVATILGGTISIGDKQVAFSDVVALFVEAYRGDLQMGPYPSSECAKCQFRTETFPEVGGSRSGFHECWSTKFDWTREDFSAGTVLDLWNFRRKGGLMEQGVRSLSQVTNAHVGGGDEPPTENGMSARHRQWYQCRHEWPGGGEFFLGDGLGTRMASWRYPLHFIDFETSSMAVPFRKGHRPYEIVAFQFSHHVMYEDGRVVHEMQFLEATPGVDPSIPFLRTLKDTLSGDGGTILHWANHENTVLGRLIEQLNRAQEVSAEVRDLTAFVESITTRNGAAGARASIDLCKLAERFFFHPSTKGSSSLKKVLPAVMSASRRLREIYERPVYGSPEMPSLNLEKPMAWWVSRDGVVGDPYRLLPPMFADVPEEDRIALGLDGEESIAEGGAAMAAYARLQFEGLDSQVRTATVQALLRYCELDTLAMVMVVQAWKDWIGDPRRRRNDDVDRQ